MDDWYEESAEKWPVDRATISRGLWGIAIMAAVLIGAMFLGAWLTLAKADSRPYLISEDYGGVLGDYISKYDILRAVGAKVVIDGMCISACTAVLGLMPKDDVCATDYGRFGFHTASNDAAGVEFSASGTSVLWSLYPADVVKRLASLGLSGKEAHHDLVMLPATDFVARCKADREAHS